MQIINRALFSSYITKAAHRSSFASLSTHQPSKSIMTELLCEDISAKLRANEQRRSLAQERSWAINASLVRVEMYRDKFVRTASDDAALKLEEENLDNLVKDTVLSSAYYNNIVRDTAHRMEIEVNDDKPHPRAPKLDSISTRIEDFARYKSLRHYLATGTLISPSAFIVKDGDLERNIVTDEEYLAGACIGLCQDLVHFGVTRAANAGVDPTVITDVQKARDIVAMIFEELLKFDFRNSPLRKKYDGIKYSVKSLETLQYELSVANVFGSNDVKKVKLGDREGDAEMARQGFIPEHVKEEIEDIRKRFDSRDQLRECLIKTCRDGQKAAKQAIFALHREDIDRALTLLRECERCVTNNLMPILNQEPELRGGSFSGVLEEYVEAYLFYTWLQNEDEDANTSELSGKVLDLASLPLMVSPEEYLGGLCDLSGEIGRLCVRKGTARDKKAVQQCLETTKRIHNSLRMIGKLPSFLLKKKNVLKISVEKMERMMYELSLMEMTGRNQYTSSLEQGVDEN